MTKQKQKALIHILFIAILLGIYIAPRWAEAAETDIVINEIGAYESSENEWLEIFNKGTETVDLSGWKFYEDLTNHKITAFQNDFIIDAGEYAIIANVAANFQSQHPNFLGTILDSSWSSLKEGGEEIGLKNALNEIIESFTYIACPNTSLQRIDHALADYTEVNWKTHELSNSAGKINEFPEQDNPDNGDQGNDDNQENGEEENESEQNNSEGDSPAIAPKAKASQIISSGTVVINEFVSDPADGDIEWIEIYNKNSFDIDLSGWTITDGAETTTNLNGILGSNYDNRFFVIENPKGKLNNSGDAIIIKDEKNNIIDGIFFGNWDSGFIDQNAPTAKDPNSVARIFDGANTYNNKNDFVVTQTPTKGETNIIVPLQEEEKEATTNSVVDESANEPTEKIDETTIIINEIYPNPAGSDLENEYIELKNVGTQAVDIANWKITDSSKMAFKITDKNFNSTIINPNDFFIIERKISKIALNNDKDTIKLLNANDKTRQTAKYSDEDNLPEDISYIPTNDGDWLWTTTATKGQENILTKLNHFPEINLNCPKAGLINEEIICDASDSFDIDGDDLQFNWQINKKNITGPIINQAISQAGTYIISLTVSDKNLEIKETQKIKISEPKIEVDKISKPKISATKTSTKKTSAAMAKNNKAIVQAPAIEIEDNNQGKQILKYLVTSAVFLGLGLIAAIKRKKKAPNDNLT